MYTVGKGRKNVVENRSITGEGKMKMKRGGKQKCATHIFFKISKS